MTEHVELPSGTTEILGSIDDGVGVITFNRPERRNPLSPLATQGLRYLLDLFESDPTVRVVVLTGAGPAFSAGADVGALNDESSAPGPSDGTVADDYDETIRSQCLGQQATAGRLFEMPKPTLAALPGAAAGAGLGLALACDLRIASKTAFMTTAFGNVGVSGDFGVSWFLTQLVGTARAKQLMFLSERISAEEALRIGLVNWVVDPERLEAETMALATRLAHGPSIAIRYMKENINRAVTGGLADCMNIEAIHTARTRLSADHREAVRAFVEKRPPVFRAQ